MHMSELKGLCFLDKNQKTFQFRKSAAKLLSMYVYVYEFAEFIL